MQIDVTSVDHALMTTRAVRRRLDLERTVDQEILLECIDIAEQAPSGGNQGSRRWIIVQDQEVKERLAQIYMESAGQWMIASYEKIEGTGHPQEKVMASAAHLAQHLAEVPAIVIPTIIGVLDGSGRPGLFDSVIQATWSFCVALRARGLGSAWTTAILSRREDLAELLGIPEGMTQIAMLPVAWMKGTDVRLAPRRPAREITYFDRFAATWKSGPQPEPAFEDGPGVVVERDIKALPASVWQFVSDINFPSSYSAEFVGASWDDPSAEISVGSSFTGSNQHDAIGEWDVPCFVSSYSPERSFGWVTSDPDNPGAQWLFELERIAGATRLRFSVTLGPGPSGTRRAITQMPDKTNKIIKRRLQEHRTNMEAVVEGIQREAERVEPPKSTQGVKAPLS